MVFVAQKIKPTVDTTKMMNKQAGYGLLFLLLISSVGYALLFSHTHHHTHSPSNKNLTNLKQAKRLLLAYAHSFPFTLSSSHKPRSGLPPMLPCPSLKNSRTDGTERVSCGAINVLSIGLFPWRSLGAQPLFSAQGECLWYAVAGNVKRNNIQSKTHFNLDSDEWIKMNDQSGVAVLLALKKNRPKVAKSESFRCRQHYDPASIFPPNLVSSVDTKKPDVTLDLSNQDSFDVVLLSREDLLSSYTKSDFYHQQIDRLGHVLTKCIASISTFSTASRTWHLPYASPINLADDRKRSTYKAKGLQTGRFPFEFSRGKTIQSQCTALLINTQQEKKQNSHTNTLFRVWTHSKNQWFLKVFPGCRRDGKACLKNINDTFFVLVVYANSTLNGQSRLSSRQGSTDRNNLANYLEGNTLKIFQNVTDKLVPSTQGNDQRYCINLNKQVSTC